MSMNKSHILVIDDNEDILVMLQAMLQLKGHKVSVIQSFTEVDKTIERLLPDVILMDMLLSGADGRLLCKHFKATEAFAHIPVIMISAHPDARKECLEAGANFFVEKPFEMEQLLEAVERAVA
jgi:CheY-like chemotaxis protein